MVTVADVSSVTFNDTCARRISKHSSVAFARTRSTYTIAEARTGVPIKSSEAATRTPGAALSI